MAEGWAASLKGDEIEAYSAGLEQHGLNSLAVKVMNEAGVDISTQSSKTLEQLTKTHFDYVITLCGHAQETCPLLPGVTVHKGFEDPPKLAAKAKSEEEALVHYRRVRDQIRDFILTLPQGLPQDAKKS